MKIPLAKPDLSGNEQQYVADAIRSTWISSLGKYIENFESEFARICEAHEAMGVCNGTIALHLALLGLDVRRGDEVLLPALTYVATANAVTYVGAEPVFVDVDPETWCIDPNLLESKITRRTKGIIGVDIYGHPADWDAINHIAAVHGLWAVEDAAEAHLGTYKSRRCGSLAEVATFSFYGNKLLTCGEGGAVCVHDPKLGVRLRVLRGQGADTHRRYYFPITGYNFRITNIACAILCAQMERSEQILARRREIFAQYRKYLGCIPGICFQPVAEWARPAPWLFSITVDRAIYGRSRDELIIELAQRGIETRPFFVPLHTLPPYREQARVRGDQLPVTEQIAAIGMNLPTFNTITESEIQYISEQIDDLRS